MRILKYKQKRPIDFYAIISLAIALIQNSLKDLQAAYTGFPANLAQILVTQL